MANALPILLVGGAALYYFTQKSKGDTSGGNGSKPDRQPATLETVPCAHEVAVDNAAQNATIGDHQLSNIDELREYTHQLALNQGPVVMFFACEKNQEMLSGINDLCKEFKDKADFIGLYSYRTEGLSKVALEALCKSLGAMGNFTLIQASNGQVQESTINNTPQFIIRKPADLEGVQSVLKSLLG